MAATDRKREQAARKLRVAREGSAEPRLPHELDQSVDQQHTDSEDARGQGRQAADALARGHEDTGPAPVFERLARRHFNAPAPDGRPRRR